MTKININPVVGVAIAVIFAVVLVLVLYHANTRPQEGSLQTMSPTERAAMFRSLAPPRPVPGARPGTFEPAATATR